MLQYTAVVRARNAKLEIVSEISVGTASSNRLEVETLIELAPSLYAFRSAFDFLKQHHANQGVIITTEIKVS